MTSFSIFRQNWKIKETFKLSFEYFENIMENEAFALKEQMLHSPYFFFKKYIIFQRRQNALLWSKGLK